MTADPSQLILQQAQPGKTIIADNHSLEMNLLKRYVCVDVYSEQQCLIFWKLLVCRMPWRSTMRTTHPSSPSAASLEPSRSLTGATSPWRKPSIWDTLVPTWRGPFPAMTTRDSLTAAFPQSNLSRCLNTLFIFFCFFKLLKEFCKMTAGPT